MTDIETYQQGGIIISTDLATIIFADRVDDQIGVLVHLDGG